jgi:hypothetical protein
MSLEVYKAALDWLDRGFHLLPIQPGTKRQAQGYGLHQQHITNMQQAAHWFNNLSKFNLAVIAPEDKFVIDFDDWGLYLWWVRFVKHFCNAPSSYTEITPNDGAHVFINGQVPQTFSPIPHVEIKRVVLVAPSVLAGITTPYEVMIDGEIYSGSLDAVLFPLSKSPPQLAPASRAARVAPPNLARSNNKLDRIKSKFSILDLMRKHHPKVALHGRGRYITACCPFHAEKESSFWIDTEKNLFGCHACKTHGDVINFFALVHHIENSKAIEEMSKAL